MTKQEILNSFDSVISALMEALDKQTTLTAYVKIEAKIEAYRDAANLINNALADEEVTPTPTTKAKSTTKD